MERGSIRISEDRLRINQVFSKPHLFQALRAETPFFQVLRIRTRKGNPCRCRNHINAVNPARARPNPEISGGGFLVGVIPRVGFSGLSPKVVVLSGTRWESTASGPPHAMPGASQPS